MDKDEMQRILDTYDPTGRRLYEVRNDLTLDFYENNVGLRYSKMHDTMMVEVLEIENERE